jgi:hypothetical protein
LGRRSRSAELPGAVRLPPADNQHHRYTFGTFTLCGDCHVKIQTGSGTEAAKNRYCGVSNYVWNNTGDKVTLVRASGRVVDFGRWA